MNATTKYYIFDIFKKLSKTRVVRDKLISKTRIPKIPKGWYLGRGKKPIGWILQEQSEPQAGRE